MRLVTSDNSAVAVLPPQLESALVGGYDVVRELGEGGTGVVYLAQHRGSGRTVALKLLRPEFAEQTSVVDAFIEEARTVARLGHENIIDIYYGGRFADGSPFLAMEYLHGQDLSATLANEGPLPWDRARSIFLQVARALQAAHEVGVIHGDIKPGNIFIVPRASGVGVKVLDFGAAQLCGSHGDTAKLTRSPLMATPQYMSPEQVAGGAIDARADVYALGCVMYRAVSGVLPIEGSDPVDILIRQSTEEVVPLRIRRPELNIPGSVERIVMKALAKNPKDRFQTMEEMADAIERSRFGSAGLTPMQGVPKLLHLDDETVIKRRKRQAYVGGAFAVLALSVAAAALLLL